MFNHTNAVASAIIANPFFSKAEPCFVSVYTSSRHYGGAEEGGWWYSRSTLVGSVPFATRSSAEAYLTSIERQVESMQNAENEAFKQRYLAASDRAEARGEDLDDDFASGETWDADQYSIVIEAKAGSFDDSREPAPTWE